MANPNKRQSWCKTAPTNPEHSTSHGNPMEEQEISISPPRSVSVAPIPGRLSAFMHPTAAYLSKVKGTADTPFVSMEEIARARAGVKKGPKHKRHTRSAATAKGKEKSIEQLTEQLGFHTISEQRSLQAGDSQPTEPQTQSSPIVDIVVVDVQDGQFDPELFQSLKRLVLALDMDIQAKRDGKRVTHPDDEGVGPDTNQTGGAAAEQPPEDNVLEQYKSEPDPGHNLVIIAGPHNIGFSLTVESIYGRAKVITDILDEVGMPSEGQVQELVFPDLDPYGFLYVLRSVLAETTPSVEKDGRKAHASMLDAAAYLQMPEIVSSLRLEMAEEARREKLDIEVAIRFANSMYKYGSAKEVRAFWHEDGFLRRALRQATIANIVERSEAVFGDRSWMVPGFKLGLASLLENTRPRV
ncbi:hypothetical protein TWF481_003143 [Arthrobotrys musiformis]|uniref:BTB domain-containing protein n=1 Tax=Arthrobotrys musiformis TaxID=47236 RepID=A0AAV9VVR1_9PEZI